VNFAASSGGNPLLARPFVNIQTGLQASQLVANLASATNQSLVPLRGNIVASYGRELLWGAEASLLKRLCCGPADEFDYRVDCLIGPRFLHLAEDIQVVEAVEVPAGARPQSGTRILRRDEFDTTNEFYGGQVGLKVDSVWWRCCSVQFLGKIGLGVMQQTADIQGNTEISQPGQTTIVSPGGLLALPTNIGEHSRARFVVVPELGIKLGWQAHQQLRLSVGYNIIYASSVARPGDQVDLRVNTSQIPPSTLVGEPRPAFQFKGTDWWAQGISFGLMYTY
jgi:hypothetical protein